MKSAVSNIVTAAIVIVVLVGSVAGTYYATSGQAQTVTIRSTITQGGGGATSTVTNTVTAASQAAEIKIGFITSLTGVATDVGKQMIQGAQYAVDQINNGGGLCYAGSCHKVSLDIVDNGDTTDIAVVSANKLLQDQVVGVIGFLYTGSVFATQTALMSHKVPILMTSASAVQLTNQVLTNYSQFKYMFRVGSNDSGLAYTGFSFLQLINAKSFYAIAEDFQYAHYEMGFLGNFTKSANIQSLGVDFTPFSATDYSSEILKIVNLHPSAVVGSFSGDNGFAFLKQYKADPVASHIPIMFLGGPWGSKSTIDTLNSAQPGSADYIVDGTLGWNIPLTKLTSPFCQAIEKTFSFCNIGTQGVNYDAVQVLTNAIRTAGTTDPDALVKVLEQTDLAGASGRLVFTAAHQVLLAPGFTQLPLIEWIKGSVYVIYPPNFAQQAYVRPP